MHGVYMTFIAWIRAKNVKEFKSFLKAFKLDDDIDFQQAIQTCYMHQTDNYDPDIVPYFSSDIFHFKKLNFDLNKKKKCFEY